VHPPSARSAALELIAAGINDCEISRRLGIPRGTIRDWRRPTYVPRHPQVPRQICPRCWRGAKPMRFSAEDYCELLGLYLGDGCISDGPRTTRLRITLDLKYPGIINETRALVARCFPSNRVDIVRKTDGNCVNISVYSLHLPCLFPQHGPGRKHKRTIRLEPWQWRFVDGAPGALLRGLIRSDGCVFINRTDVHRPQPYEYLTYEFANKSRDIIDVFVRTCELIGVEYRLTRRAKRELWSVRINRRSSVARMLEHVGIKE
jgi:LAGLIDADG DNA endonuclease family protein/Homeodomain-like domain-containing protein